METSAKEIGEQPSALAKRSFARLLLACGVIGPLIFILVFLIEGATRTNYSPLRHPVSSLSFGDFGWTQMANFVMTGYGSPSNAARSSATIQLLGQALIIIDWPLAQRG